MANENSTVQDNATPEQLAKQFPLNVEPFGISYLIESESYAKWGVNDENGDGFIDVRSYGMASVLSEALRDRHNKNNRLFLDTEQQKAINHALLIVLDSFGEIERISDEVGKFDLVASESLIPESIRPIHPTGSNDTISTFATALRFMQQTY